MKIVFCGTPEFAEPSLRALLGAGHTVELVVSQPDRPAGRGMILQQTAVKRLALERGLKIVQPESIKTNPEFRQQLEAIAPDVIVVVAYGHIVPEWMLRLPKHGNINVHGSLLPRYRGAAPVQWAVANGDRVTGVTTMRLDAGLDTGPMLLAREVPVPQTAIAIEMLDLLADVGAELLVETLREVEAGRLDATEQDHSLATLAPLLTRADGLVDWRQAARVIYDRWRGFYPWPGSHTVFRGKKLILHEVAVGHMVDATESLETEQTGGLLVASDCLLVACGALSVLEVRELQVEGKKRMSAAEFVRGYQARVGERLG